MSLTISIIVPVYNVSPYLGQCLDSVRAFGQKDTEVILVNDGSTDDSGAICQEYANRWENVKLIEKSNGGLSDARNEGVKVARGKYVYFLDSDDWLVPGAIDVLCRFAEQNKCDVVQGGFYYAFDDHLELDNRYLSEESPPFVLGRLDAMRELIKNNYIKNFAWGKLYRSDIVKRHQFPIGKYFEDSYWQHLIINECNQYGVVPLPLYFYRQRQDSISSSIGSKALDLFDGYEERLKFIQLNYPELVSLMADRLWRTAFTFYRYSNKNEFRDALKLITAQYEPLFTWKLRHSIVYLLSRYESQYIRKSFLFLFRVYEFFTVKRLKKIKNLEINKSE